MDTQALAALMGQARQFATRARAGNTLRAYRADGLDFEAWCEARQFLACPASAQTVALYLTALSRTHKVSTLTRRLSAISQAHRTAGLPSPTGESSVRLVMAGIRRSLGTAAEAKRPVLAWISHRFSTTHVWCHAVSERKLRAPLLARRILKNIGVAASCPLNFANASL